MSTPNLPDAAGAADQFIASQETHGQTEVAGATDAISVVISQPVGQLDLAAAVDGITVVRGSAPAPVPGTHIALANPAFILSQMPRMHVQNLLTGRWIHRDVQGVTSPSITWTLNNADAFTCTLAPPRADMMDATGNAIITEWRDAVYLEENDEIKFGGICTQSTMNGPAWQLTAMGFSGYPNSMPYEGPNVSRTRIDALDAVRLIWNWLQGQTGGNIGLELGNVKSGYLLGNTSPPGGATAIAGFGPFGTGTGKPNFIWVANASVLSNGMQVLINGAGPYTIKTVETTKAGTPSGKIDFTGNIGGPFSYGMPVIQVQPVQPWVLNWYNSTDCGSEIQSIMAEAIFDFRENHYWADPAKQVVRHQLVWGVPRIGVRLTGLRFCEGENIVQPAQVTRDGTKYANEVVGLGAGSGNATLRSEAANANTGRLRRSVIYQDQTLYTVPRVSVKANKVLAAMQNIDTVGSIVVKNHRNAPFGSFAPGDDIPVTLASGWRNTTIWSRITAMTQDPTTDLMTLTLARSDSFTYMPATGLAGTI